MFRLFVEPFLPLHIREKVGYAIKFVRKYLSQSDIRIELVSRAVKREYFADTNTFNEFRTKTIQMLRSNNLHISDNDDLSVKFAIPIGDQSITTIIDFVSDVSDDDGDELLFESIDIAAPEKICKK